MKILMLTPYLPYPPSSGGQIRSFNLIKHLSKKHDITLFSLIKGDEEKKYISELKKYCQKVVVFNRSKSPWTFRNILLTGFGRYPFLVIRNLSSEEKEAMEKELVNEKYDLIHAETFYVMPHIPKTKVPVLLVDQTIEYSVYEHFIRKQAPLFLRLFLWIDVAKLRYWERAYWQKADKVVAVSETDKKEMYKLAPQLDVRIVPNGVNLDFFKVKKSWKSEEPRILFVANFKWLQNAEAAELLLNEVYPEIIKEYPQAKSWIVGQHVPEHIKERSDKNILVEDVVENDEESIRKAYHEASVFVSPLRGPGGTRLKHLAAMASKLPLVTTTVGAEGLSAEDGKNIVVRDDPKKMAGETVKLLKNPAKARRIAENARHLVEEKYSWKRIAEYLDKIYKETAKKTNTK